MKKAILARKVGMTQIFDENGVLIPVTVLLAGPCVVTQVKTEENDGYNSVQVAYGQIRTKLVNKAKSGHLAKAGVEKTVVENGDKKREVFAASESLSLRMHPSMLQRLKSKLTYLLQEIKLMRLLSQRVKDSRALLSVTDSQEDL